MKTGTPGQKIRLLIVDDSALYRAAIAKAFENHPRVRVVGTASNPYEARDKIMALKPDVMTLDVEMPRMNGIEFLKILMPQYPLPVVVVSSLSSIVFEALRAGAVDFVQKPGGGASGDLMKFQREVAEKVVIASETGKKKRTQAPAPAPGQAAPPAKPTAPAAPQPRLSGAGLTQKGLIALGASTGGTEATADILKRLPPDIPGMVITQHMPPVFTDLYAKRLNKECALTIKEAKEHDVIQPGHVYIAPGDRHLIVDKVGPEYIIRLRKTEKVNGHIPSVDVMFESIARFADRSTTGIILTGMGADGAQGLLDLKKRGAYTIGQDEASCVVYGMPMVAKRLGAVTVQAPLNKIADILVQHLGKAPM